jgi:hypothetical protein
MGHSLDEISEQSVIIPHQVIQVGVINQVDSFSFVKLAFDVE